MFKKAITKAAARHISQGRVEKTIANFPSDIAATLYKRIELQKNIKDTLK